MTNPEKGSPALLALGVLLAAFVCYWTAGEPFFWDTIQLGARHADWFYQQNFHTLLLPDEMDSGHVPAFGWYLAAGWKLFGQSLWVSHFAMLPWLVLVFWQLYRLLQFTPWASVGWGMLLFLADPTLVSQLTLISPDVILVGAFLLAINSIFRNDRRWLAVAIILLGLISLRGMMVALTLFAWQWLSRDTWKKEQQRSFGVTLLPYLPGGLLALSYLLYHYVSKGWLGVHDDSPWAASFAGGGPSSWLRQIALLGWRSLDFGRVFLWICLGIAWWQRARLLDIRARKTLILCVLLGLMLGLPAIISPGLAQHRYLLPFFLVLTYLFWQVLFMVRSVAWRRALYVVALLGFWSGNFWVYPDHVAQGWDASLAHKPYFAGRDQAIRFLREKRIPLKSVGTVFPEVGPIHWRELNGESSGLAPLDMTQQQYVLYSNVMNDYSDKAVQELWDNWTVIFLYKSGSVYVEVLEKKP